MSKHNLKEALVRYYTRQGSRVIFKNKYSMNELSLEMWDILGYQDIDVSSLSRVINGKRLFTIKQLYAFCSILKIKNFEKEELLRALESDYLKRYGLDLSAHGDLPNIIHHRERRLSFFLIGFYIPLLFWWFFLFIYKLNGTLFNLAYGLVFSLIPLFGGLIGIIKAHRIKAFNPNLSMGILLLSLGLLTWAGGTFIWSYYNLIMKISVPYPSWADISYILSWPLWLSGIYFFQYSARRPRTKILINKSDKMLTLSLAFILMLSCYSILALKSASNNKLKLAFDLIYPTGDILVLIFLFLVSGVSLRRIKDQYKQPVSLMLVGFFSLFVADFSFSYTTTMGTFYTGNWVDLLFTTATLLLSFGIGNLDVDGKEI